MAATKVIQLITSGPRGPKGDTGATGADGTIGTGSIAITGSFQTQGAFMNATTMSHDINIPSGYNALLIGPIYQLSGNLIISASSNLTIL